MFRITMNYVHDKEEALDVMQDSFHKALNYFEKKKRSSILVHGFIGY